MLENYSKYINELFDKPDSVLMIDADGYVEYSATYDHALACLSKDNYIGKHILDVYPSLTKETSTHFRVMRTNRPIINEKQNLIDMYGNHYSFVNSSFPITSESGTPIGSIEFSILISKNHIPHKKSSDVKDSGSLNSRKKLYTVDDIITENPTMQAIKKDILKLSSSSSCAMIWGETGTGKELIAESLHIASRNKGSFVSVNCSALPASLFESLLFGTKKGSFTGAEDKKGLLEMADGGTLFLDELNSMDISLQPKLLKVIEQQKFRPIGSEKEVEVNVRFIAAMNMNPEDAVSTGLLRQDLYYRLDVIDIHIPPLRERPEDILPIIDHYIHYYSQQMDKNIEGLTSLAKNALVNNDWPGNIRELRNSIEYAVNMTTGKYITLQELPARILPTKSTLEELNLPSVMPDLGQSAFSLQNHLNDYEKTIILNTLQNSENITAAAKKLGLTRQALQYKMQKHHIIWEKKIILP